MSRILTLPDPAAAVAVREKAHEGLGVFIDLFEADPCPLSDEELAVLHQVYETTGAWLDGFKAAATLWGGSAHD